MKSENNMYPFPYTQLHQFYSTTNVFVLPQSEIQEFNGSRGSHDSTERINLPAPSLSALESKPVTFHPGFPPKVSRIHQAQKENKRKKTCMLPTPQNYWDTYSDFLGESWLESRERAHPKTKCWPLWPMGLFKGNITVKAQLSHKKKIYAISNVLDSLWGSLQWKNLQKSLLYSGIVVTITKHSSSLQAMKVPSPTGEQGLQIWDHVCYFKHLFWRVNKFETETISQYVWKKKQQCYGLFEETVHVQPGSTEKSPPVLESTLFTCEKTSKNHRSFTPHEEFRSSKLFSGGKNRNLAHKNWQKSGDSPIAHFVAESSEGKRSDVNVHRHSCQEGRMDPRTFPKREERRLGENSATGETM